MMKNAKKTIVFFPAEPGIAHVTRSLAIASELAKRGHRILFALQKEKWREDAPISVTFIDVKPFLRDRDVVDLQKAITHERLRPVIAQEVELLKQYKPDLAVVDFRITAFVSCNHCRVPIVFLSSSGGLPYGSYIPNPGIPSVLHQLTLPLIQHMVWNMKKRFLTVLTDIAAEIGSPLSVSSMFDQMTYIVPEPVDYLSPVKKDLAAHYVGPIFWEPFEKHAPSWLQSISRNGKTVYLTFGDTGYDAQKLIQLSRLLLQKEYRVIVSTSTIADPKDFGKHPNLFVDRFLPGNSVCQRSDIVVCHGGYGTMMQAILAGIPVVAVPFNPDQFLHSMRFQELGLGRSVTNIRLWTALRFNWQAYQREAMATPVEQIVVAVEETLQQKERFHQAIETFRKTVSRRNSASHAADVIEARLKRP